MKMQSWKQLELLNPIPKLEQNKDLDGFWISLETGKFTKIMHHDYDTPWDHVNPDPKRKICSRLQKIFRAYKIVPPFCQDCWKVCVKPRTFRELINLRELQYDLAKKDPNIWSKCGIEIGRYYVTGIYGGYFYTDSKTEGLNRYRQVRKFLNHKIPVILKRYCTEMEATLGDSSTYKSPPHAETAQQIVLGIMDLDIPEIQQPPMIKQNVFHTWLKYAWKYATPEDRAEIEADYNDGEPFFTPPRTYHNEA